ncbi:uracil-DNA glycosylase [Methylomonas sp. AM2-LC]|uniref:uracil-DNA glycosylase n=1 Tax=Methylomonas sp. AM2-LC TaxID=3153301 RepID=UPI003265688F
MIKDFNLEWTNKSCSLCENLTSCRTQIVLATPSKQGGLLAIGEAPGHSEDVKGEGFVGIAGKTLDRLLLPHGIGRNDYGRANICRCRPPENRKPTPNEIEACLPFLVDLIQKTKPKVILTVGGTPTSIFFGKGSLYSKITDQVAYNDCSSLLYKDFAHKGMSNILPEIPYIVPTPHTSPLAFNRNAPSGEKWAVIAERQVDIAVKLLLNH